MVRDGGEEWVAPVCYLPGIMRGAEDADRAARIAIRALARRGLSRGEVERELRSRNVGDAAIAAEIGRLQSHGIIDDVTFARDLVVRLQERKGYGRQAVAAELARRLVAPAAIEDALDLMDADEEVARAERIARRQAQRLRGLDRVTAARRLSAYLVRRGYGGSTVHAAVEHALAT